MRLYLLHVFVYQVSPNTFSGRLEEATPRRFDMLILDLELYYTSKAEGLILQICSPDYSFGDLINTNIPGKLPLAKIYCFSGTCAVVALLQFIDLLQI